MLGVNIISLIEFGNCKLYMQKLYTQCVIMILQPYLNYITFKMS